MDSDLEKYKLDAERDYTVSEPQRDKANEDMRFCNVDGGMWEGYLERTHGDNADRVRMEFDLTSDYVQEFIGEWTENRASVEFEPGDEKTSEDDAELLNGIYRADYSDFDGQIAHDVAVKEMAECGVGHLQLITKYQDESDLENDNLDVHFKPLYNSFNHVIWESNAKRIDKADARRCTVLTPFTNESFEEEHPGIDMSSAITPTTRSHLNWWTPTQIMVAERYEVKEKTVKMQVWQNLQEERIKYYDPEDVKGEEESLAEEGWEMVNTRKMVIRNVYKSTFVGTEFIEKDVKINGEYIPIIPIYGFRTFVDGVEYYRGLIRKLKDANRAINTNVSRMVESGASSPDEIPIFTRTQVKGLRNQLADSTNKPYQVINDMEDREGNKQAVGPVGYMKPPMVDPNALASTQLISDFIRQKTGDQQQQDADLRNSGEALKEMRSRVNIKTKPLVDNILTSIRHEAKVYRSICKSVYSKTRSKRTMGVDGTTKLRTLNQASFDGDKTVYSNTVDGKFEVKVSAGANHETKREATVQNIKDVIGLLGEESEYNNVLIATLVQNLSGEGLDPLKDFNRKKMIMQGLMEPETDEEKQMVMAIMQQKDPNQALIEAATAQQMAEAQNLVASAQDKKASSIQRIADAKYKNAKALEATANIGSEFVQRRLQQLEGEAPQPRRLRYNPETGQLENAGSRAT